MFNKTLLILLVFFFPFMAFAQIEKTATEMAVDYYQEGEAALLNNNIKQAKRHFEKSLQMNPNIVSAYRGLGICYEIEYRYEEALDAYEKILQSDSLFSRILYYQMGEICYKLGRANQALEYFHQYEKLQNTAFSEFGFNGEKELEFEPEYLRKLPANIKACQISLDSAKFVNITTVLNLGPEINTKAIEYFPFLSNDQRLIFFNRRKNAFSDEDLYYSRLIEDNWTPGSPVQNLNTTGNEGMPSLVRDGRKMYFTACGRQGVLGTCDIWEAEVKGHYIESVDKLSGFANSDKWESEAAVSCDGRTLYFASTRDGGYGGTDLWYSIKQGTGLWSRPINMGPKINTPYDEESPFITNDGKTLYFASTGHPGLGEQDIFVSWYDGKSEEWSVPINIGPPVNSPFRELGFFLSADGRTGYFASDRPGGFGEMDIYKFELNETLFSDPITFVEGFVRDSVSSEPIATTVNIKGRKPIQTKEDGRFFLCVGADELLDFEVSQKDYLPLKAQFAIPEWDNRQFYVVDLLLQPISFFLDPEPVPDPDPDPEPEPTGRREVTYTWTIYFQFDQSQLNPNEMNKVVDFIEDVKNKNIQKVDIIGYADDIGDEFYNLTLSEERAKTVAMILIDNEMIVDKIYLEGKGEIKDGALKIKNRRVDLKVVVWE
ncbi:MAG: PD40 domain-containing protein [Lewinellaceae bacterium]|nr:PD40 domain-containing protein [Lewinellaceae bacterium]